MSHLVTYIPYDKLPIQPAYLCDTWQSARTVTATM